MESVKTQIFIWVVFLGWCYEEDWMEAEVWLPF